MKKNNKVALLIRAYLVTHHKGTARMISDWINSNGFNVNVSSSELSALIKTQKVKNTLLYDVKYTNKGAIKEYYLEK